MDNFESAFIQDVRNQATQDAQVAASKKPKNKKIFIVVAVISVLTVALVSVFIWSVFFKQSSLVCSSDKGDITIYYNHSKITDYKSNGMELNLEALNYSPNWVARNILSSLELGTRRLLAPIVNKIQKNAGPSVRVFSLSTF